mmetsp:Transcript_48414/g.121207  ORF Transcript_48414/g.121207 Transcript_48414/m.121207 type:complete len:221 (+) Transcript_48414:780-1442(+)
MDGWMAISCVWCVCVAVAAFGCFVRLTVRPFGWHQPFYGCLPVTYCLFVRPSFAHTMLVPIDKRTRGKHLCGRPLLGCVCVCVCGWPGRLSLSVFGRYRMGRPVVRDAWLVTTICVRGPGVCDFQCSDGWMAGVGGWGECVTVDWMDTCAVFHTGLAWHQSTRPRRGHRLFPCSDVQAYSRWRAGGTSRLVADRSAGSGVTFVCGVHVPAEHLHAIDSFM